MTVGEYLKAIETGIEMVKQLGSDGYQLTATGEMGIDNIITSSAVASALIDQPPVTMTERGTGFFDEGLKKKM